MNKASDRIVKTYVSLTLLSTFASSFIWGINTLFLLDAGLSAPFIGRFRRAQIYALPESSIRRLARRRQELEDLDRRRGTILRLLEKEPHVGETHLAAVSNRHARPLFFKPRFSQPCPGAAVIA